MKLLKKGDHRQGEKITSAFISMFNNKSFDCLLHLDLYFCDLDWDLIHPKSSIDILNKNDLNGEVIKAIALNCPNLETLIMSCSGVSNDNMIFLIEKLIKIKVLHLREVKSLTDQFVQKIISRKLLPQLRHLWFGDLWHKCSKRPNISKTCLDILSKEYGLPCINLPSRYIPVPKVFTSGIFMSESERGYY